ncbi:hypothetical protein FZI93_11660, partial [Mycobacterium sp. CBMA361]|nr:hypothetical protein [Mycolicibacterium sp. CBMA 361]
SANCHREHFGEAFNLRSADGAVAAGACCRDARKIDNCALLVKQGHELTNVSPRVASRMS